MEEVLVVTKKEEVLVEEVEGSIVGIKMKMEMMMEKRKEDLEEVAGLEEVEEREMMMIKVIVFFVSNVLYN